MNKHIQLISITLLIILLTGCSSLIGGEEEEKLILPIAIEQWAIKASASSAAGGLLGENRDDQSPYAATGEPDVNECGESLSAWVIKQEDDGLHWLELEFYDEVFVSKVRIKESWNPGSVSKVELKNENVIMVICGRIQMVGLFCLSIANHGVVMAPTIFCKIIPVICRPMIMPDTMKSQRKIP